MNWKFVSTLQQPSTLLGKLKPLAALVPLLVSGEAYAVQTGTVAQGMGTITQNGAATNIAQQSDKLIVNWKNFDIGAAERVDIQQPTANAAILNRVQSADTTSIQGALSANGRVFVVNPNGIVVGKSATINANSVVLSAADVSDSDFLSGDALTLQNGDGKTGSVQNNGSIITQTGAALVGAQVVNGAEGQIVVNGNGDITLAAGSKVTMALNADGSMGQITVDDAVANALAANDGKLLGTQNGAVGLSAFTADTLASEVVRNTGVIGATSIDGLLGRANVSARGAGENAGNAIANISGQISGYDAVSITSTGALNFDNAALKTVNGKTSNFVSPGVDVSARQVSIKQGGAQFEGGLYITGLDGSSTYAQDGDLTVSNGHLFINGFGRIQQNSGDITATGRTQTGAYAVANISADNVALKNVRVDNTISVTGKQSADLTGTIQADNVYLYTDRGSVTQSESGVIRANYLNANAFVSGALSLGGRNEAATIDITGKQIDISGTLDALGGAVGTLDNSGGAIGIHGARGGSVTIGGRVLGRQVDISTPGTVMLTDTGVLSGGDRLSIAGDQKVELNGAVQAASGYTVETGGQATPIAAGDYAPGQGFGATNGDDSNVPPTPVREGLIAWGDGLIAQNGKATNVTQQSNKLVINWNNFDTASDESINFYQPGANAAVLNRVQSGKVTNFNGTLNANGRVYIVNPDGIVIGKSGVINANSVVLAAANLSDSNFLQGGFMYFSTRLEGSSGRVQNAGSINTKTGAALLGLVVENLDSGSITSLGNVVLVAAGTIGLSTDDIDGGIQLAIATDGAVNALVVNDGSITADGGSVSLEARAELTAPDAQIVRNTGQIEAIDRTDSLDLAGYITINGRTDAGSVFSGGAVDIGGRLTGKVVSVSSTGDLNLLGGAVLSASQPTRGAVSLQGQTMRVASGGATIHGNVELRGYASGAKYFEDGPLNVVDGTLSMIGITAEQSEN
jgi:filamentous hemagglutinin family protein